MQIISQIKECLRIEEVIGAYVALKPAASLRKVGLCPFHREKTGSFSIDLSRQRYHCFGCGADGDVIDFVSAVEGISAKDAIASLAGRAGIPLDSMSAEDRRAWGRKMRAAEREAAALVSWKREAIEQLRAERNRAMRNYHWAIRFILGHSLEQCIARGDLRLERAIDLGYTWPVVERLDAEIDRLMAAGYSELLPAFRASEAS